MLFKKLLGFEGCLRLKFWFFWGEEERELDGGKFSSGSICAQEREMHGGPLGSSVSHMVLLFSHDSL